MQGIRLVHHETCSTCTMQSCYVHTHWVRISELYVQCVVLLTAKLFGSIM